MADNGQPNVERPNVLKAVIIQVDKAGRPIQGKEMKCQFNPTDFEMTRIIEWNENTNIGGDAAQLSFAGGKAQDLTLSLLFDTTETGKDVRDKYKILRELALIDPNKKNNKTDMGEPHHCRFQWGRFLTFTAAITKLTEKFTMFMADGVPLRAEVTVTFKQLGEIVEGQNPTTRSETRKTWVVHEGQSLDWIAYQEYGSAAQWRHIAETNGLDNPRNLRPGQILKLTPLP